MNLSVRIPDWYDDAACAGIDPDLFFPDRRGIGDASIEDEAVGICRICPVRTTCLDYALGSHWITTGIWGGTTENQRRRMLGKSTRQPPPPHDARHGTPAGYQAHRAANESPCPSCKRAHADERKRQREARKESA